MTMALDVEDRREEWEGVLPVPSGITETFWAATTEGRFLLQHCSDCESEQFYPRIVCTTCGGRDLEWVEAAGHGEVHSYTVCHRPGGRGFVDHVPYAVAVVELAEGPQMMAFVDDDHEAVEVGSPVELAFWQVSDDAALPVARLR
jgi:uncharacterized OB-fold protein